MCWSIDDTFSSSKFPEGQKTLETALDQSRDW